MCSGVNTGTTITQRAPFGAFEIFTIFHYFMKDFLYRVNLDVNCRICLAHGLWAESSITTSQECGSKLIRNQDWW